MCNGVQKLCRKCNANPVKSRVAKTGREPQYCEACYAKPVSNGNCYDCGVSLPYEIGKKGRRKQRKVCDSCKISRVKFHDWHVVEGKSSPVQFVFCMICKRYFCRSGYSRAKSRLCSSNCLKKAAHADAKKLAVRFRENPFTFKLSDYIAYHRTVKAREAKAVPCGFCGSVKILGDQQQRNYEKTGRAFCDEDCASEWKSIHYRTSNYRERVQWYFDVLTKKAEKTESELLEMRRLAGGAGIHVAQRVRIAARSVVTRRI
jgi:hypothetical protein